MKPEIQTPHTPGPWETIRDATPDWHTQITVYAESGGSRVATVFENPANARLIAAAPDMFAALKDIVTYVNAGDDDVPFQTMLDEARAAIAKAVQS